MEPTELIDMPSTAPGNQSSVEEVSDLNGLAIPAMLEVDVQWGQQTEDISLKPKTKTCSMYSLLKLASQEMTENGDLVMHSSVREKLRELKKPVDMTAPADFLKLAAVYQAGAGVSRKGYISRLVQLQGYDWMTLSSALACLNNLRMAIPDYRSAKFEYLMQEIVVGKEAKGIMLQGQADIVTPAVLWEVKCVQSLLEVHFLQLGLYAWLWRRNMEVMDHSYFWVVLLSLTISFCLLGEPRATSFQINQCPK